MTKLFETIAIKQGRILNIKYHNERFLKGQLFLNKTPMIYDIKTLIDLNHADYKNCHTDIIRCRITYDKHQVSVAYFNYMPKSISSYQIITCNNIEYDHKYDDRDLFNELSAQKGECDEIIIIKNNSITDCTIGNLLFLKNNQWYTPDTPLLHGTQRSYLLGTNQIHLATIKKDDIWQYEKVMMINALNEFDESRAVIINQDNIKWRMN